MERSVLALLLAGCTAHAEMPAPTTPAAPARTFYGHEVGAVDLVGLVGMNVTLYELDKHHASRATTSAVIAGSVFAWAAAEGAIHVANDHPLGAVIGPALKLGLPALMLRSDWFGDHPTVTALVVLAAMIVDDGFVSNRDAPPAAVMSYGRSF